MRTASRPEGMMATAPESAGRIFYQNNRKDRTMFTGKVEEVVSKYSSLCIDCVLMKYSFRHP
jgi:hypothetical protein